MSRELGFAAEQKACEFLLAKGLRLVTSNYRCRLGEIDLIMRDGPCLVFVEVRARKTVAYGGAVASITYSKQQKLIKTALLYLQVNKLMDKQPLRFDVLSLEGVPARVSWIQNAFEALR